MERKILLLSFALVAYLLGSLGAKAAEAYANYTSSNKTLTFYNDDLKSSRSGKTYSLNTGTYSPGWQFDGNNVSITHVVFDPSFAEARPVSAYCWFSWMVNLQSITGIQHLNTSNMTTMHWMFQGCKALTSLDVSGFVTDNVNNMDGMFAYFPLTSLDVSNFNTSKVKDMSFMFSYCTNLTTIYVGDGWSTSAVTQSLEMFIKSPNLKGGQGTTYDANHIDAAYAHIDGGPSNPGYFTKKSTVIQGDVNNDGNVNISDVTALINYILSGDATAINLQAADFNQNGKVNITDITDLINYLLSGS